MTSAPDSFSEHERARLLTLLRAFAYEDREVTLASGQTSRFYVDCKQVMLRGEGHYLLGRLFLERVRAIEAESGASFAGCGGMSVGADPLSSGLSLTAFHAGRELPAIYVRKEAKGHGTGAFLEGTKAVPEGSRVVMVEDVVTTGGSSLKAAARLRDHGYVVEHLLAIVDRKAGGEANLADHGLKLHALFSRDDFPGAE
jgi:orotate phosphoribosyltransferase